MRIRGSGDSPAPATAAENHARCRRRRSCHDFTYSRCPWCRSGGHATGSNGQGWPLITGLTVPYGYGSQRVTIGQLEAHETWAKLHPEFKRRVTAMFVAANGHVGCGTGWRSTDVQRNLFLQRHVVSKSGTILWDGKRWALKPGMAPAAPPGSSFHEGLNNGLAMAIDVVGDAVWADAHAAQFGLVQFSSVNHEPWHFQCVELPHGVTSWIGAGRPQPTTYHLASPDIEQPAQPVIAPTGAQHPILHVGDHGPAVATMQALLIKDGYVKDTTGNRDGRLGPATQKVLEKFQADHGLAVDGICGPATWRALSG
jgi:Putative peptidoglycan binding domain